MKKNITDFAIDLLNEALELDREAVADLCGEFVFVNDKIANHPTIICGEAEDYSWTDGDGSTINKGPYPTLGLLGLLNGILGRAGFPLVAGKYDEDESLIGFCHYAKSEA